MICCWILIFQEFEFEVIIKIGKQNFSHDYLSHLQFREAGGSLDDGLLDTHLFKVDVIVDQFVDIVIYLMTDRELKD